ncbi:TPM domain-containing protein [Patescibacteria group bacterium]|nr:TPM domain-containing protein [Patescibacteria group bacterium]MBU2259626.1 TPM domain-containing protein [Patescibacteria group bacterium]
MPFCFICTASLLVAAQVYAFEIPPNDGFVTDSAQVLTSSEEETIENVLQEYRQETSNEIAILIVDSMEGEVIADTAFEVGRAWGVGTEKHDNGILILIAYSDRELFIATGYGLEGAVPDIVAKGIIDLDIVPHFKDGKYADGILAGIESLKKHIGGEYTADRYASGGGADIDYAWIFFVIIVLLQWLIAILARTKSWWLGGVFGAVAGVILVLIFSWWLTIPLLAAIGLLLDYVVSKNYKKSRGKAAWWAGGGWGGGGRGGGGFGGFGGGSFGGGGAGGGW